MDYKKIYDSIISKAKSDNRKKFNGVYYELHHIIPKCIGGDNYKENKVLLTAKEHYMCHKLLCIIYEGNKKLIIAFQSMINTHKKRRKLKLTSREYADIRILHSNSVKGQNNPNYNKKASLETKKKQRDKKIGKKQSPEHIKSRTSKQIGRKRSIDAIIKTAKKNTGRKMTEQQNERNRLVNKIRLSNKENHPMYNKKHKDSSKKIMSEKALLRYEKSEHPFQNKNHSEETRLLMSEKAKIRFSKPENNPMFGRIGHKSPHYGKKQSAETIAKRVEKTRIIREERRMMIF